MILKILKTLLAGLIIAAGSVPASAQDQLGLGTSTTTINFVGNGTPVINVNLQKSSAIHGTYLLGGGNASGSGTLGSLGQYTFSSLAKTALTLQPSATGGFSVTQVAPITFIYTSTGGYGFSPGTQLVSGTLLLANVAMNPGSTNSATAIGTLIATGGVLSGAFNGVGGNVNLALAIGSSLNSLINTHHSVTGQINVPSSVTASGTSLQITTNSLSAGVVGLAYTAQLSVIDGVTPYNWTLSSGALPAGLGLAGSGM
ncbi:MAG: hypothetical protein ACYDA9_18080, partial [Terriglobia bacterium]